jgi:hypothetical protein
MKALQQRSTALKIPYKHLAAAASIAALAGGSSALANQGNGHGHGGATGPTGATGATGTTGPQGHGKGKQHVHTVMYVFKGTWTAADGTVKVTSGNHHVRKAGFVGQSVQFDLTSAKFVVADTNSDSSQNAADLKDGDKVLVQARLPRKDPGDAPYKARKLVDQTNPPQSSQD